MFFQILIFHPDLKELLVGFWEFRSGCSFFGRRFFTSNFVAETFSSLSFVAFDSHSLDVLGLLLDIESLEND
jgi:hypothetical protein